MRESDEKKLYMHHVSLIKTIASTSTIGSSQHLDANISKSH